MLKITVDSNVIISSLLKKDSVPARVISYILNECQLYISQFINVLACAVAARVDYLISGDNHLRKLGSYEGIKILSPSEFLEIL